MQQMLRGVGLVRFFRCKQRLTKLTFKNSPVDTTQALEHNIHLVMCEHSKGEILDYTMTERA